MLKVFVSKWEDVNVDTSKIQETFSLYNQVPFTKLNKKKCNFKFVGPVWTEMFQNCKFCLVVPNKNMESTYSLLSEMQDISCFTFQIKKYSKQKPGLKNSM